tara:strand:+ start:4121 stop:4336 length:216 start_codon:yes stop_codon:yes gene_type:complete
MKGQTIEILTHLEEHGSIDPLTALRQYGCFRLAARIHDLRFQGHKIETKYKIVGEKRYAEYLIQSDELRSE